jgi:hypothetical protein
MESGRAVSTKGGSTTASTMTGCVLTAARKDNNYYDQNPTIRKSDPHWRYHLFPYGWLVLFRGVAEDYIAD